MAASDETNDTCLIAGHPTDIRPTTSSTILPIRSFYHYPLFICYAILVLHPPNLLGHFFIYLCSRALRHSLFSPISHRPMVSTRPKNKKAHPAAPVMSDAAKQKAGIAIKKRQKKATKDETIRELQARVATLENPAQESFSKEPLVRNLQLLCLD